MKISYHKLFIMILCISQSISAVILHNNSNKLIRYNIFKKDFVQKGYNIDPLPKSFGKIQGQSSKKIKELDPQHDYIVIFYDVYNCNNNKVFEISGSTQELSFEIDQAVA